MPQRDIYHDTVKNALIKDGWTITHDPLVLPFGQRKVYVDIRDGKIWIQHDGTGDGIANELLAAGVPHEKIVLAFHHPHKRKYTPFAVS